MTKLYTVSICKYLEIVEEKHTQVILRRWWYPTYKNITTLKYETVYSLLNIRNKTIKEVCTLRVAKTKQQWQAIFSEKIPVGLIYKKLFKEEEQKQRKQLESRIRKSELHKVLRSPPGIIEGCIFHD